MIILIVTTEARPGAPAPLGGLPHFHEIFSEKSAAKQFAFDDCPERLSAGATSSLICDAHLVKLISYNKEPGGTCLFTGFCEELDESLYEFLPDQTINRRS
jgi:hypothetical protein